MKSIRTERLEHLIQRRVAMLLLRDLNDPRVRLVTVTKVKLARDLSHCQVFWSTLEEGAGRRRTERGIEDARGFLQREVAAILDTKATPFLDFVFDSSIEGVDRVFRLIKEARDQDDLRAKERGDSPEPTTEPPKDVAP